MDVLAETLNKIKVYERIGKDECVVASTKLVAAVLDSLQKHGYVKGVEKINDGKFERLKVVLAKKINDIGVVKPRHAVSVDGFQKYEMRYIPSRDFGMLIVSTPSGVMTNEEARQQHTGGRLLAYVY